MPTPACSFCDSTEHVQKLFDVEPAVYACESCAALQRSIVRGRRRTSKRDDVRVLRDWTTVEVEGDSYRWMALRTTVSENSGPSEPMVMIMVGKLDGEAVGVLHPDGTDPTEEQARNVVRKMRASI